MSRVTKSVSATVCLILGLVLTSQSAWAQNKHGSSYAEWAESWWTWILETPVLLPSGSHPIFDDGTVDCSIGQDGHVWFLTGKISPGEETRRSCSVPTGTALFFPLFNNVYINFTTDPPLTPENCAAITDNNVISLGKVTITVLLDGKPLKKNAVQFEESEIFSVQMPTPSATETNLMAYFGYSETEFKDWEASANCDFGWYGYIEPLSVGRHIVQWKVESSGWDMVLQDVRYELTVGSGN
jgi:hypothetical protein